MKRYFLKQLAKLAEAKTVGTENDPPECPLIFYQPVRPTLDSITINSDSKEREDEKYED